jgi:thioesterase domain-containing protein
MLADELKDVLPVVGIQAPFLGQSFTFENWQQLADYYVQAIVAEQPQGPYMIGAYSGGGRIAAGVINRLLQLGRQVDRCLLFDSYAYFADQISDRSAAAYAFIEAVTDGLVKLDTLPVDGPEQNLNDADFYQGLADWLNQRVQLDDMFADNLAEGLAFNIRLRQLPAPFVEGYAGKVHCWFSAQQTDPNLLGASWASVYLCSVDEHSLDARHLSFLEHDNLQHLKPQLLTYLGRGDL